MTTSPAMPAFAAMAPLVAMIFLGFLAIGTPMAALALHLHDALGFSPVLVGLVIGAQSVMTVLTRHMAGTLCDARGPRRSALIGLPMAALAGLLMLAAIQLLPPAPLLLVPLMLLARALLGAAESFFLTATMSWGIRRMGPARTGRVMAWQGIAMYASLGAGAPLGLWLLQAQGIGLVLAVAVLCPLAAAGIPLALPSMPGLGGQRLPFYRVIGLVWLPGSVLALSALSFVAMTTFLVLHYQARGWAGAGTAMALFVGAYILVRLCLAHLPDRQGGIRVGVVSLIVQTLGQVLLWLSPWPALALLGAVATGGGCSLIFPAMGVEATRRVPAEQRGQAVGNFVAFFDLALGLGGPLLGMVALAGGSAAPFLAGAIGSLAALVLLRRLWKA